MSSEEATGPRLRALAVEQGPRAAWRLERLGLAPVYDYVAGKVDWMAAGLATVRADDGERPGPTTVRANEPLDPLLERMRASGVAEMTVTTPEGRLLGVVRRN